MTWRLKCYVVLRTTPAQSAAADFGPAALTDLTLWKIDAPAQLISDIFPFHERAARSISPSETSLRPSEI